MSGMTTPTTRSAAKRRKGAAAVKAPPVQGVLRCHARGFGFITHEGGEDIFVPARELSGLLDGDVVRAEVVGDAARGVVLVERERTELIGTVARAGVLQIDPGVGIGEIEFLGDLAQGHAAVVRYEDGIWHLTEDLGDPLDDDALYRRIMLRHRLPVEHDEATELDASNVAGRVGAFDSGRGRIDLRDQLVITIDADHSKDLDDALSARIDSDGSVRVWVHIADVAEHVSPGSPCDLAARATPTSVYLPMRVRPMLPTVLSEEVLSLVPGVERDVLTVEMRIAADGSVSSTDVYESRIKSRERLSYHTVAGLLRGGTTDASGDAVSDEIIELVRWLWSGAARLGVDRKQRGGVEGFRLGEARDDEADDHDAHTLVERLMVATNEVVARWLEARDLPVVYRCHAAPDDESLGEIEATADAFGYKVRLPRPVTPVAFSAFADQISNSPHVDALWDVIGGALARATYTTMNVGHFGLGSNEYLHFTSPLRRYADLTVHRVVKAYLHGERGSEIGGTADLEALCSHITEISNRAGWAERDARSAVALRDLLAQSRRRGLGVVKSVSASQIRVHVPVLAPTAGTIPVRRLGAGWRVDEVRREAKSQHRVLRVGGEVHVRAKRVEPLAGVLELQIVTEAPSRGRRGGRQNRR